MCTTCGCGEGNLYIEGDEHNPHSAFRSAPFAPAARPKMKITGIKAPEFTPSQTEEGDLHYGHGEAGTHAPGMSQRRMLEVEIDVLDKNNRLAERNRARFAARKQLVLNLVSSPGSGKTTLLTETLMRLKDSVPCAVIEGDQQTVNDAARIRATGTPAIQVNTGKGCHLDAQMIADAAPRRACHWTITVFCLSKTSVTSFARPASISVKNTKWRCFPLPKVKTNR